MNEKDERPGMEGHEGGDRASRQARILGSLLPTVAGTLLVLFAGGWLLSPPARVNSPLSWSLRWVFLAFLPYAAVCLVILNNRLAEGSHDPRRGAESEALSIHVRVMQNTLEQWVWFGICVVTLSTLLRPQELHLLPLSAVVFVVGRLVYWRGYFLQGTLGRRFGVQITFTLNIGLLVLTTSLSLVR